ncbi:MAG: ABC transporter permease, partial [Firmicutes bacterium]|nr:ABC transporter permease [Bacillota bacterium]
MKYTMKPDIGEQAERQRPSARKNSLLAEAFGLKTILRQPKKALLFLVLLATVVTLLTLVLCVYHAVSGYLAECDDYYHTMAELEYFGRDYPSSHAADPAMASSLSENADALEQLLTLPGVTAFDQEDALLGVIPGIRRKDWQVFDKDAAVIVVRIGSWERTNNAYSAIITGAPFAWGDVLEKITYIDAEEGTLRLDEQYVLCGHFIESSNNLLLFQPEDTLIGTGDGEQVLAGWQALGKEALPDDSPYLALAQVLQHRNNGYRVNPVADLATLRPWQQGELKLLDGGRLFAAGEYETDAKVCVISNILSTIADLSVGDTIEISLNDCQNMIYSSWTDTLAPAETYTIVGIYYRTSE